MSEGNSLHLVASADAKQVEWATYKAAWDEWTRDAPQRPRGSKNKADWTAFNLEWAEWESNNPAPQVVRDFRSQHGTGLPTPKPFDPKKFAWQCERVRQEVAAGRLPMTPRLQAFLDGQQTRPKNLTGRAHFDDLTITSRVYSNNTVAVKGPDSTVMVRPGEPSRPLARELPDNFASRVKLYKQLGPVEFGKRMTATIIAAFRRNPPGANDN